MLLLIVRRDATDFYDYLHLTFADQPVAVLWDRRVRERRRRWQVLPFDSRRRDRRDMASLISLERLPFIAVRPAGRARPTYRPPAAAKVDGRQRSPWPDDLPE